MGKHYDINYLNKQIQAMRWLYQQGLTPDEIRVLRWGSVDETTKKIRIRQKMFFIRYDLKTGVESRIEDEREIQIPIEGSGNEWFFLKSKFKCPWMFTAHEPKTWRKQGSEEALFPVTSVEKYCTDNTINGLTFMDMFDNIEVSKLNITNSKPQELIREAEVLKN